MQTIPTVSDMLSSLGIAPVNPGTSTGSQPWSSETLITSFSPVDGAPIAQVSVTTQEQMNQVVETAQRAFLTWRQVPAPKRGEVVRQFGMALREKKEVLGALVSYEMGKSYQ